MGDVVGSEIFLAEQQLFMVFAFIVRQSYLQGRPDGKEARRAGGYLVFTAPRCGAHFLTEHVNSVEDDVWD